MHTQRRLAAVAVEAGFWRCQRSLGHLTAVQVPIACSSAPYLLCGMRLLQRAGREQFATSS
eukprot:1663120-Amphidinium_carterae.1